MTVYWHLHTHGRVLAPIVIQTPVCTPSAQQATWKEVGGRCVYTYIYVCTYTYKADFSPDQIAPPPLSSIPYSLETPI